MKLVSEGVLEKVKHSFRLSHKCIAEKEKARAKAETNKETKKEAQRKAAGGGASGIKQQVRREETERKRKVVLWCLASSRRGLWPTFLVYMLHEDPDVLPLTDVPELS